MEMRVGPRKPLPGEVWRSKCGILVAFIHDVSPGRKDYDPEAVKDARQRAKDAGLCKDINEKDIGWLVAVSSPWWYDLGGNHKSMSNWNLTELLLHHAWPDPTEYNVTWR